MIYAMLAKDRPDMAVGANLGQSAKDDFTGLIAHHGPRPFGDWLGLGRGAGSGGCEPGTPGFPERARTVVIRR
jgi:hypothetical protein